MATDEFFDNVVLLLHCDGADGSTAFPDSSSTAKAPIANGDAQVDTALSKFGGASALFDGAGDFISVPDHADFHFGLDDFTIDLWIYPDSIGALQGIIGAIDIDWNDSDSVLQMTGLGTLTFVPNESATQLVSTTALIEKTWAFIRITRESAVFKLAINGIEEDSVTAVEDMGYASDFCFGSFGFWPYDWFIGNLDDIRISKGIARDITEIPTAAFPDSGPLPSLQLFRNNAQSTLLNSITGLDISLELELGGAAAFGAIVSPDFQLATLQSDTAIEIIKITSITGDILTVERAQEGGIASGFSAGDEISARLTAATLARFIQKDLGNVFEIIKSTSIDISAGPGPYALALPADFLIDSVQFVAFTASGVTVQASISVGSAAAPAAALNNQPTVGLTANGTATKWALSQPVILSDILITIDTLATATEIIGRFYFNGVFVGDGTV